MENYFFIKATQLALKTASRDLEATKKVLDLNSFRGQNEMVFRKETVYNDFSFFLLDVTLDENLQWRLIEANGSNAALSSTAVGGEMGRVDHLLQLFLSKKVRGKVVVLFVHQFQFIHLGEFFNRAALFAYELSKQTTVSLVGLEEVVGQSEVTIVAGEIGEIARRITVKDNVPMYMHTPIVLASNPNLLPELVRLSILPSERHNHPIDTAIFQEQSCTGLIHDKSAQQYLCEDTGLLPIEHRDANSLAECFETIERFAKLKKTVVAKMNAGSGGTGIDFFEPGLSKDQVQIKFDQLVAGVRTKYTAEADRTMFPIRFFEFVKSTPLLIKGAPHMWDLRMQVAVYPKRIEIRPCVVRVCPEPFDGSYNRPTVVSNLSGRTDPTIMASFMFQNPYYEASPIHHMSDISKKSLSQLVEALFNWAQKAIRLNRFNYLPDLVVSGIY